MNLKKRRSVARWLFRAMVALAAWITVKALRSAGRNGWRRDCLNVAAQALPGALKNIDMEDGVSQECDTCKRSI